MNPQARGGIALDNEKAEGDAGNELLQSHSVPSLRRGRAAAQSSCPPGHRRVPVRDTPNQRAATPNGTSPWTGDGAQTEPPAQGRAPGTAPTRAQHRFQPGLCRSRAPPGSARPPFSLPSCFWRPGLEQSPNIHLCWPHSLPSVTPGHQQESSPAALCSHGTRLAPRLPRKTP